MAQRYFLEIAYKGTNYHGWQAQENATLTIQGELNRALGFILRQQSVETVGSGRTDAGVHCKSQYVHFDAAKPIDNISKFIYSLNRCLPADILVKNCLPVHSHANARFSALSRSYEYHITREKDPFSKDLSYQFGYVLDVDTMNAAAALLLQYNDFQAFSKVKTDVKTFRCRIFYAYWEATAKGYVFYIKADRFLRGMVRTIVGSLLEVGLGKQTITDFQHIIESGDRKRAGRAVPPQGLFLCGVEYPAEVWLYNVVNLI
ncbi:MAG: tRNA pseudouridine(38-40) synthase TruA [Cytophagales bacterium]|nr:tRNA pseudouridine(38-40) synthase TruA [Bernardetiaceae bacterium]MDW8204567.1 tRNA pseudouridine(38-40) synthase TruA [Cytophagales bacterium]